MAKILIGISGSIAAYKMLYVIRELQKQQHQLKVVLTENAQLFITPELIAGVGIEVYSDNLIKLANHEQATLHITLAKWSDFILIAPASANLIASIANGFANNLLLQILLATPCLKRLVLPAMNAYMWANAITKENITKLVKYGYEIGQPEYGVQACGDIGEGRLLAHDNIINLIAQFLANDEKNILMGKVVVITLGSTIEPIDPVRYISNHSSGKMGIALINAALNLGAKVIAIHGNMTAILNAAPNLQIIAANMAQDMLESVLQYAAHADIFISCAAICDYRVRAVAPEKIKKDAHLQKLELVENSDIVAIYKAQFPNVTVVGFAAETENLIENAKRKLVNKNLDFIVANHVAANKVFNQEEIDCYLINKALEMQHFATQLKSDFASKLLAIVAPSVITQGC